MVQSIFNNIKNGISLIFKDESDIPQQNIAGLYFDVIQGHNVSIQNQITDNWLENNNVIGDHIAHQPIVLTLRGLIGELVYAPPIETIRLGYTQANTGLQYLLPNTRGLTTEKLLPLAQLLPPIDNITQLAKNLVQYSESSFGRYVKIIKNFNPSYKETKLQQIYNKLVNFSNSNTSLIVETPYKIFNDMYIQSIEFSQENELYSSDIVLTLKQVYFKDTITTTANKKVIAKYSEIQRATVEDAGNIQGIDENVSLIKSYYNKFWNLFGINIKGNGIHK